MVQSCVDLCLKLCHSHTIFIFCLQSDLPVISRLSLTTIGRNLKFPATVIPWYLHYSKSKPLFWLSRPSEFSKTADSYNSVSSSGPFITTHWPFTQFYSHFIKAQVKWHNFHSVSFLTASVHSGLMLPIKSVLYHVPLK